VEGWLDGFMTLKCEDLDESTSLEIAKEMAKLHCSFDLPPGELRDHYFGVDPDAVSVGLWDQLKNWTTQARSHVEFKTPRDAQRVKALKLDEIEREVDGYIEVFSSKSKEEQRKGVVFCHNDLLPANIMKHSDSNEIQLIDFEYGGTNYSAFDIANHFNEYAGGVGEGENGNTDYSRFPSLERQQSFCVEYIKTASESRPGNGSGRSLHEEAADLLQRVEVFVMINHLYCEANSTVLLTSNSDFLLISWQGVRGLSTRRQRKGAMGSSTTLTTQKTDSRSFVRKRHDALPCFLGFWWGGRALYVVHLNHIILAIVFV